MPGAPRSVRARGRTAKNEGHVEKIMYMSARTTVHTSLCPTLCPTWTRYTRLGSVWARRLAHTSAQAQKHRSTQQHAPRAQPTRNTWKHSWWLAPLCTRDEREVPNVRTLMEHAIYTVPPTVPTCMTSYLAWRPPLSSAAAAYPACPLNASRCFRSVFGDISGKRSCR